MKWKEIEVDSWMISYIEIKTKHTHCVCVYILSVLGGIDQVPLLYLFISELQIAAKRLYIISTQNKIM